MGAPSQDILLVEPWFASIGHVPFNRAFLAIVREAYPDARITFACSREHWTELADFPVVSTPPGTQWLEATAWPRQWREVSEFWRRARWLNGIVRRAAERGISPTHLIILGASGPLLLALWAVKILGLQRTCRTFAVLHGVNDVVHGWRPRNPWRRFFTFRSALQLLPHSGVKVIALETFIADDLRKRFPRQAESVLCIPHGLDETEDVATARREPKRDGLRILFLGQATPPKGFREFAQLARRAQGDQAMEFRVAGALRADAKDVDQSALSLPASELPLQRREILSELSAADVVFMWQSEYYDHCPSGVLVDCIAAGVPIIGRRSTSIAALEETYGACGLFADDLESLYLSLVELLHTVNRDEVMRKWRESLGRARNDRTAKALGALARRVLLSS